MIEGGETDGVHMLRVRSGSEPLPAGKMGARSPDVPAQSWGDVKGAAGLKVEASP